MHTEPMTDERFTQTLDYYVGNLSTSYFDDTGFQRFIRANIGEVRFSEDDPVGSKDRYDQSLAAILKVWQQYGVSSVEGFNYERTNCVKAIGILGQALESLEPTECAPRYRALLKLARDMKDDWVVLPERFLPLASLRVLKEDDYNLFGETMRTIHYTNGVTRYAAPDVANVLSYAVEKGSYGMTELFDLGYSAITKDIHRQPDAALTGLAGITPFIKHTDPRERSARFARLQNDAAQIYEDNRDDPTLSSFNRSDRHKYAVRAALHVTNQLIDVLPSLPEAKQLRVLADLTEVHSEIRLGFSYYIDEAWEAKAAKIRAAHEPVPAPVAGIIPETADAGATPR